MMHNFMFFVALYSSAVEHIGCNKEWEKRPQIRFICVSQQDFQLRPSEKKQRNFRTWVIHQGQETLFIVEEEILPRPYTVEEYRKAKAMYSFKAQTFYKSVELVGVKALGCIRQKNG